MRKEVTRVSTEMVLMEAARVRAMVRDDQVIIGLTLVICAAVVALLLEYAWRRWTWIPRRRQRSGFGERF